MTISADELGTKQSILEVTGRYRKTDINGFLREDWLSVDYNGNICKVSAGFYGKVDEDFAIPKKAIIQHMVIDERSRDEILRFPVFIGFQYE